MPNAHVLVQLAIDFGLLSIQAVGGGAAVIPAMQHVVEGTYHITPDEFSQIYGIGNLAPGPNMLMVVILGNRIAGIGGGIVVLLAFLLPSSLMCFWAGRIWDKIGDSPWRRAVQYGFAPIAIGLMASGVFALAKSSTTTVLTGLIAAFMLGMILRTKINPTLLILTCGLVGAFILPNGVFSKALMPH
ncbi:MAG: chromate transporter [Vulcanimicrobiaceae bacterium]